MNNFFFFFFFPLRQQG